jgi:preprotein translocase subunit SecF
MSDLSDLSGAQVDAESASPAPKKRSIFWRLYHGQTDFNFMGRIPLWFAISAVVVGAGLISLFINGLNLGIDFEGGVVWEVSAPADVTVEDAQSVANDGAPNATVQEVTGEEGRRIRVQSEPIDKADENAVTDGLAELAGTTADEVSLTSVGPSWGDQITAKAQRALVVFLLVISLYITLRFEFRMAMATLAALFHDILLTVGLYSIFGFEVTPATVIAVLTILGYSIYDGIVVFDRIDENTRLVSVQNRLTYRSMVNRSLNEVLMRTLNTSITALIPILSMLFLGSFVLGASTLEEFGLALFIGLASGAYSSIFIASPVLVLLKEREHRYQEVAERIEMKEGQPTRGERRASAKAPAGEPGTAGKEPAAAKTAPKPVSAPSAASGTVQPRARKVKKRRR